MFTEDVQEQLKYYVYRLIDPRDGQTFYVGKGKGNRVFAHVNDSLKCYEDKSYSDENEDDVSTKLKQIRDIHLAGLEVIHIIQRYGLTEKEAFEVEAALIDCFPGLTNIQGGHDMDRGVNNAEVLQKALSSVEFDDVLGEKYIIIKITKNMIDARNGNVYEAVRKYWGLKAERANQYPYVLAVVNGIVNCVYKVDEWYPTENEEFAGRCEFRGKEAPLEIQNKYRGKKIPARYRKKGMAQPFLYHD